MAHEPFEMVPIITAGVIGTVALIILINFFDSDNSKFTTYAFLGFVTGAIVQIGVRLAGVS